MLQSGRLCLLLRLVKLSGQIDIDAPEYGGISSRVPSPPVSHRQLLDENGVYRCLDQIASEIHRAWPQEPKLALVGIYRRGVPFSESLATRLRAMGREVELGRIDITQYRDDLNSFTVLPRLEGSDIRFQLDDAVVILCDEVIYTARTCRAALEELLGFGRPRCVELAVLVDRVGRQMPFQANYVGISVELPPDERVNVCFSAVDGRDEVFVSSWDVKPS
ncbi:MAG: bifunctional pyr operon transcriptional regulator/uracil phosphoribosyltransferase PyrR [Prosthecobacter sp.]|nr:bifunctional pyr operon transcriptional regulator/uracil phosphoribosyltransferase PyrR [Prosthecobacter sp.]